MKPIIENDKDQRIYEWLLSQVGQQAIDDAINKLVGQRKPYLTNIVKILGLKIPKSVLKTPPDKAKQYLNNILSYLNEKN